MPAALTGEFAFAASGTCLVTADRAARRAWFATGGGATARVFRTAERRPHLDGHRHPVPSGPTAGIYSPRLPRPTARRRGRRRLRRADDGAGRRRAQPRRRPTWGTAAASRANTGPASAWVRAGIVGARGRPTGSDVSRDGGRTWRRFDTGSFDSVDCARDGACWASGEAGRVATLRRH